MSIRRKRFRKQPVAMAMLPFLAVLICTMGSLILLLVIFVQNASVEADTIKARRVEEQSQETDEQRALREQTEDAKWRKELLLQAREENTQQLANTRLELSHLEEHIRRLQDQWGELTRQVEDLQRLSGDKQSNTAAADAELARLAAAIDQAKRQLDEAKRKAADRPRSFAIVPVPRSNGTLRRPIYLECTPAGVILQPEGVVLGAQDFLPPLGPGNALDAALRATREYLARHGGVDVHGEPYPLMLVRPEGAVAYAAAREALRSWDNEFGYELLETDMQLAYPEADPALAEEIRRAVESARRRQELLARSAPTRFRQLRQAMAANNDPGQSLLDVGGEGVGGGDGTGDGTGAGGGRDGFGAPGQGGMKPGGANQAGSSAHGLPGGGGAGSSGFEPRPSTGGGSMFGNPGGGGREEINGQRVGDGGQFAGPNRGQDGSYNPGNPGQSSPGQYNPGQTTPGQRGSDAAGEGSGGAGRGGNASGGGGPGNRENDGQRYPRQANQPNQSNQSGGPGGNSSQSGPQTLNGGGNGGPLEGSQSMASSRGSNWALRDGASSRANAYTRPVRISLTPDQMFILPDARTGRRVQTINLTGATDRHIEQLVAAVQGQIDGWGAAPVRGYWRPVLSVQVAPGAERRFEELRLLLDDSGLEVERKSP